ncbi:MAG: hypothetical protein ACR2M6_02385, partial [Vampirovibrionia bacterium]
KFFTCETSRGFSLNIREQDPDKICVFIIGNKFVPSEAFLGKKYKDVRIIMANDNPSVCVEVIDGKFKIENFVEKNNIVKKDNKVKSKKGKKKDDAVNVPKQGKPSKADKSS